jgi:hypothetical protein
VHTVIKVVSPFLHRNTATAIVNSNMVANILQILEGQDHRLSV